MKSMIRMVVLVIGLIGVTELAQGQKIAHVNSDSLLRELAVKDSVIVRLEAIRNDLEREVQALEVELERAKGEYEKSMEDPRATPLTQQLYLKKYQDAADNYQLYRQAATEEFSKKQEDLYIPVMDKIKKAIAEVAKEKGYTYVIDDSALLYSLPADDITGLVRQKLGL